MCTTTISTTCSSSLLLTTSLRASFSADDVLWLGGACTTERGGRERGREGEGRRERWRGREGGREEGGREKGWEGGREGERERERGGGRERERKNNVLLKQGSQYDAGASIEARASGLGDS